MQEVLNLQYYDSVHKKIELDDNQRDILLDCLDTQKTISFNSVRKLKNADSGLLFPRGCLFNLETGPRDKLNGNATAIDMRKAEMLGDHWDELTQEDQNDLLEMLHDAGEDEQLIADLVERFHFDAVQAKAVSGFKLSPATSHLSRKFMVCCTATMRDKRLKYDAAVREICDEDGAFLHHSKYNVDEILPQLPYYGELLKGGVIGGKPGSYIASEYPEQHYGKINNPTVHVALNQVRKLINCLVKRFGLPAEIHVELVRDLKKTAKARNDISKKNAKFNKANDKRADLFRELYNGEKPSGQDLKKIHLWEELGSDQLTRNCPFTGLPISAAMLFNGEVEIEHILPFKRTLDDSAANLTVAIRQANRVKGDRTPYEAFADDQYASQGMVWFEIAGRVKLFPKNKRWRFDADAMDRFEKENGFIARQLTDNAYISRVTKRYLSHICDGNKVVTIPGGLTAMMRGKWRLNALLGDNYNHKERDDHRHHIVDAFVVGLTDRRTLQKISEQTARGADDRIYIKLPDITPLRDQLSNRLDTVLVSFKPDHGMNGKMYNETAYGLVSEDKRDSDLKDYNLVTRKKIDSLTEKEIGTIRNFGWRSLVKQHVDNARALGTKLDKNGLAKVLAGFGRKQGIKTIRILVKNQSATVISSAPFKAYAPDSFVCVDIWQIPKGKTGEWKKGCFKWQGVF